MDTRNTVSERYTTNGKASQVGGKRRREEVEHVLGLYRDQYDLNVLHFHEKLAEEHVIQWSYSWVTP